MNPTVLGIDVSKDSLDCTILDGEKEKYHTFPNTPKGLNRLFSWLKPKQITSLRVGMESTGRYHIHAALFFVDRKSKAQFPIEVFVINPFQASSYSKSILNRNKTDKVDAAMLAKMVKTQSLTPWSPPSASIAKLQELVRTRQGHMRSLGQYKNRIKQPMTSEISLNSNIRAMEQIKAEIETINSEIQKTIEEDSKLKTDVDLLETIPAIGNITATAFMAEIQCVERFPAASSVAAFAGVTPRQHQSGKSVSTKAHISRIGNANLRTALYLPTVVATRCNPIIKAKYERLVKAGKPKKSAILACEATLIRIMYGVLKHQTPFVVPKEQAEPPLKLLKKSKRT